MSINISRRIAALEASMAPKGKRIVIWGLTDSGEPMTDKQIESEIEKHRAAGAPANTQFDTIMWQIA